MAAETILITDGSASNSTGTGGWAAILRSSNSIIELTGFAADTTSNRMEMTAAIEGLKAIGTPTNVVLISDSAYLLNTLRLKWYERWFREEIEGHDKGYKDRPNMDLWHELVALTQYHDVQYVKVKGHSGDYWNERVDHLAGMARINKSATKQWLPNMDDPLDAMEWLKENDYSVELTI